MGLDLSNKDSYVIADEANMLLINGDENSWRDSIGRNLMALYAYDDKDTYELRKGMESCLGWDSRDKQWTLKRHPNHLSDISRDHWSYFIQYQHKYRSATYANFIEYVPRMSGLYNWMYAAAGSEYDAVGYYLREIPGAYLRHWWNSLVRFIFRIGPERHERLWSTEIQHNMTKWQRIGRKLHLPFFPLHNKAWQIKILPDSWAKCWLKQILLKEVGKFNYLTRLLLGAEDVTKGAVDSYKSMSSWRWGVTLNETNDRTNYILDESLTKCNNLEKDLLNKIYDE